MRDSTVLLCPKHFDALHYRRQFWRDTSPYIQDLVKGGSKLDRREMIVPHTTQCGQTDIKRYARPVEAELASEYVVIDEDSTKRYGPSKARAAMPSTPSVPHSRIPGAHSIAGSCRRYAHF